MKKTKKQKSRLDQVIKPTYKLKFVSTKKFKNHDSTPYLPKNLENDKEVALKALEAQSYYIKGLPAKLRDDKDIIKKIINKHAYLFQYASDRIKDDKPLVMEALRLDTINVVYGDISDRLKIDEDVINKVDFNYYDMKKYFVFKKKLDKIKLLKLYNILKKKYKTFKLNLFDVAINELRNDKELVMKIVEFSRESFQSISPLLKKDHDVIESFIKNPDFFYEDIKQIPKTKNCMLLLMKYHPELYSFIRHMKFAGDKDLTLLALANPLYINHNLQYIDSRMRSDKDIQKALDINHPAYIPEKYKYNKQYLLKCLKKYNIFKFIPPELKNDKDLVLEALKYSSNIFTSDLLLKDVSPEIKNDKKIYLKRLQREIDYRNKTFRENRKKSKAIKQTSIKKIFKIS